jgi:hypothetical protein
LHGFVTDLNTLFISTGCGKTNGIPASQMLNPSLSSMFLYSENVPGCLKPIPRKK